MSKLIVVIGATGGQGGGVVNSFLNDSEFRVRGVTRNANNEKSKVLAARGVEMVVADQKDEASLDRAFEGAYAIFAVTDYYEHFFTKGKEASMEIEYMYGMNMAKAASRVTTLKRYVWSTLPHTSAITQGKAIVPHFEGKGRVNAFIKENLPELYSKTTFTIFTIFAANMHQYPIFRPVYLESAKKWVQFYPTSPQTIYHCIGDHSTNSGIFVRAIVKNPPPEAGTYVRCNVEDFTLDSYLALWGRASGIAPAPGSTKVVKLSVEEYVALWGNMGEEQASQWIFFEFMKEMGLTKIPGAAMVDGLDLLSEQEKKGLLSVEDSLKALNWSEFKVKI